MEHGIILDRGVIAGVIAERPFRAHFARLHITFQDKVHIGRHIEIDGLALYQFDRFPSQKSGEQNFVEAVGQRRGRGKGIGGVAAEGDGDRHPFVAFVIAFAVTRPHLVDLPVHRGRALVENLHAIHADVARAGFRIARVHIRERDETAAVFWPAFQDRKIAKSDRSRCWMLDADARFLACFFSSSIEDPVSSISTISWHAASLTCFGRA